MTNECSGTQGENEATKEGVSDDTYDVLGSETLLEQAKEWVRSMLLYHTGCMSHTVCVYVFNNFFTFVFSLSQPTEKEQFSNEPN